MPGVPVVLFHAICATTCAPNDTYGMTQEEFSRTLEALVAEGYSTLSIEDYVRWFGGSASALPARPILVTFDDSRRDSWVGADPVLRSFGMRATMFVITAKPEASLPLFMSWADIAEADASKRWDIQLHADNGHEKIEVGRDPNGAAVEKPFYAWRRAERDGAMESFEAWKARAPNDIARGDALLAAHLPGHRPYAFALPYGDYGQYASNDPNIAPTMRAFLDSRYDAWFTQPHEDPQPTAARVLGASHEALRLTITSTTTAADVMAWLARHPH